MFSFKTKETLVYRSTGLHPSAIYKDVKVFHESLFQPRTIEYQQARSHSTKHSACSIKIILKIEEMSGLHATLAYSYAHVHRICLDLIYALQGLQIISCWFTQIFNNKIFLCLVHQLKVCTEKPFNCKTWTCLLCILENRVKSVNG